MRVESSHGFGCESRGWERQTLPRMIDAFKDGTVITVLLGSAIVVERTNFSGAHHGQGARMAHLFCELF